MFQSSCNLPGSQSRCKWCQCSNLPGCPCARAQFETIGGGEKARQSFGRFVWLWEDLSWTLWQTFYSTSSFGIQIRLVKEPFWWEIGLSGEVGVQAPSEPNAMQMGGRGGKGAPLLTAEICLPLFIRFYWSLPAAVLQILIFAGQILASPINVWISKLHENQKSASSPTKILRSNEDHGGFLWCAVNSI